VPASESLNRANALGVLSDLLLRTKSSLPANNPFPKDDPKHKLWVGVVNEIAQHHSDLARRLPADNADPRQYDGWALDCLKAYFIASAIETGRRSRPAPQRTQLLIVESVSNA
jgi:fermentation-respiration switch protein FrsA (DUF1100 family)